MTERSGPWKEGRAGGVSLCYLGLATESLAAVGRHHAAVGIRATIGCDSADDQLKPFIERNWDLAVYGSDPDVDLAHRLTALDGRAGHGWISSLPRPVGNHEKMVYCVMNEPGTIPRPAPVLSQPLPSLSAESTAEAMMQSIEQIVGRGHWAIWRFDADALERLTLPGHARLLQRLGDHHARIWCAPVRDIATWQPQP